jgi:hypothetical protein
MASKVFAPLDASLRSARPEECALNVGQAYTFMRETALLLQALGFGVRVPSFGGKLGMRMNLKPRNHAPQQKNTSRGLTFDSIVQFDWQLALDGEPLSRQEFEELAALKVPLVQVRGQWVELRPDQIEAAIRFWEKHRPAEQSDPVEGGELSLSEALRLALARDPARPEAGLPFAEVAAEGWLAELLKQLGQGDRVRPLDPPPAFRGTLRHYQAVGLSWLAFLRHGRLPCGRYGAGQDADDDRAFTS